jgi:tetratricopeptide (TPR) repeat protein
VPINLSSPIRKIAFAAALLCAMAFYALAISRAYLGGSLSDVRKGPASLSRAMRMSPGNAEIWYKEGAYALFADQDARDAANKFRTSAHLNPWMAETWLGLATAYQVLGDDQGQKDALERAVDAEPKAPDVAWEAGNFFLTMGDMPRALKLLRVVVENDPEKRDLALDLGWRATGDTTQILAFEVPPSASGYFAFLNTLVQHDRAEDAQRVWKQIAAMQETFPPSSAYPYIDFLIRKRLVTEAVQVWSALADLNPGSHLYASDHAVINGGFEDEITNGGFDWRYRPQWQLKTYIDDVIAHSGERSLAVEFKHMPVADIGIEQYVPVKPRTRYEFSGFMKTDDIQSSSGPRFGIYDAFTGAEYAVTDDVLGSSVWHELRTEFTAAPDTTLVVVRVVRTPSSPEIMGKAWFDDLRLTQR